MEYIQNWEAFKEELVGHSFSPKKKKHTLVLAFQLAAVLTLLELVFFLLFNNLVQDI